MKCSITRVLTPSGFTLLLACSFPAQIPDDTRGLRPREYAEQLQKKFTAKRRPSKGSSSKAAARYKPVAPDSAVAREGVDVGITFWKLRPARRTDDPQMVEKTRIVKRVKGQEVVSRARIVPTRAPSDTAFADGESMRLTIEVPFESHIYILNREEYAGGGISDPYLVFPSETDLGRSDKTIPGKLISIPNPVDYFEITRLNPAGPNKVAEVFTILLANQPIKELPPLKSNEDHRRIDPKQFEGWERDWGGRVWRFERVGVAGAAITKVEKSASRPDGELLSAADPEPQTVYHVKGKSRDTLLFTIRARIRP